MKLQIKIISFTFFTACFQLCYLSGTFAQQLSFGRYTVNNGLSNSAINCLLQDSVGFLWFGTDDGLNRFDAYEFKHFKNESKNINSVPGNNIWTIYEDRSSLIWVGTKNGYLGRYNNKTEKFRNWKIESIDSKETSITSIFEDKDGFIWIGTYKDGLYRLNLSTNEIKHWLHIKDDPKSLSNNFITSIIDDPSGNIWISTFNGLDKFNPKLNLKDFDHFYYDPNSVNIPGKNLIWKLQPSLIDQSTFWLCSLNGLYKFNTASFKFNVVNLPASFNLQFANSVSSVCEQFIGTEKILWVGTYGGLIQINLSNGESNRFITDEDKTTSLISNEIHNVIIDRSGVVWIGTDKGLNFISFKGNKFNSLNPKQNNLDAIQMLSKKDIRAITQTADKTIWLGTSAGLYSLTDISNESNLYSNKELNKINVWSLYSGESQKLWIGTYGQGLLELDIKTKKIKKIKINNPDYSTSAFDYIKSIYEDSDQFLWIGFWGGGLARVNPKTNESTFFRNEPDNPSSLSYDDIWAIHKDQFGRLWIGTNGGGLNLYDPIKNVFYNWIENKNIDSKLSNNSVYAICESTNRRVFKSGQTILWIGTANGLNKLVIKNKADSVKISDIDVQITIYSVKNGLVDNSIESIVEDRNGNLWMGTNSGISFFNIEKEIFTNYNYSDGVNGNTFNSCAAFKYEDGLLFFGSTSGLNIFDPDKISSSTYAPPVLITDFQIFNQPVTIGEESPLKTNITFAKEIILTHDINVFSFQFTALDYSSPSSIIYAYKMAGFDKDWIYAGNKRFATYTNLDPGEYVFRVKATNSDGIWNEEGTYINLFISPPFWATWWAYSIFTILFIGGLYLIRATEINRRKKKEEEKLRREREAALLREARLKAITIEQEKELEKQKIRNRIAQDLHDEIGSNLSSISLMSDLIQKTEKADPDSINKIKRIHRVAKDSSQAMRDIVWITNPGSDNLKDLITKMNEVATDMLAGINWKFDLPGDTLEINLSPETKRNVFLIFKEALNNIIKHSVAKNVIIKLKISEKNLLLAIKDNGKGFNASSGSSGNGLKNMENRAKEINGILKLNSSPGKGTTLALAVNITQVRD